MEKYELLTSMAKALDELESLRLVNDVLERDARAYKVSAASGELTPSIAKLAEYGRRALFEEACNYEWSSIGVKELEGELYPSRQFDEWMDDILMKTHIPSQFSVDEAKELVEGLARKAYDERYQRDVESYESERAKGSESEDTPF